MSRTSFLKHRLKEIQRTTARRTGRASQKRSRGLTPQAGRLGFERLESRELLATVAIGDGSLAWTQPLFTYWHDSRTQVIYDADEIGTAGSISSLALNVAGVPGQTMNEWTIRMKQTALASYAAAAFESDGWTVVYHGTEAAGAAGWRDFQFSTPFAYDGASNLMVDFSFNNTSWTSSGTVLATNTGAA